MALGAQPVVALLSSCCFGCAVPTRSIYLPIIIAFLNLACGSVETTRVKEYTLKINTQDPEIVDVMRSIVSDFNAYSGRRALSLSTTSGDSHLLIERGVKARDGKIGWGQALFFTETDSELKPLVGLSLIHI